ncbi:S-adenosyl-L-methionine-dependent tRNA 4-demethylwyosine synthase TYW1 isoform X2 [Alexandromys fortis]|uniref:S-adenosyl-L-methionine-dependent tRNA 4-demethylwyosine synthase TYW1 isoform X2 n=1 Tax=Alexandromys fortis TaxID=100897 RepID=UPI0021529749|nr:S-adenosyl-L-methionine-dependent tRNA 4-demethylwyosine synthase TYW1 isoform X2 [Microtus fortis]
MPAHSDFAVTCGAWAPRRMGPPVDVWDFSSPLLLLWMNRFYIYLGCALGVTLWICVQVVIKKQVIRSQERSFPGAPDGSPSLQQKQTHVSGVKIFYGSQTGTAKGFAVTLAEAVTSLDLPVAIVNLKEYDPDDNLIGEIASKNVCAFLVATYTDGRPTESAEWFCKWLEEAANDFRFGKTYLKGLRYAVFGLGDSAYQSHFNKVGTNVDKWLWMLGAKRVLTRGEGDRNAVQSKHGSIEADFTAWKTKFTSRLQALQSGEKMACSGDCKRGKCESSQPGSGEVLPHLQGDRHPRDAEEEEPCESSSEEESGNQDYQSLNSVVDVEDLGNIVSPMKKEKREKAPQEEKAGMRRSSERNEDSEGRAMITPALREALTKQGYQLIGSHSGVKLCRWTKSMLRGRGGCYKHTFYGIESHRCMEATPSLACANKCVFCWRHHTNPVGTEWRWKMDQPELIVKEAIENHQNMIKQFKGVPGLKAERFEEGMEVKHCALSLVGEPIMYPEINRLLKLLHQQGISSFLVTNAQFPEEIRNLTPVTQLYVSVDASTKDSLKKIDRPLFKDFWQRFLDSLKALAAKGVTYCGESAASSLTMANVPWHEEVVRFVQELVALLPDYEIACEHEHSNCLLIGHKKFKVSGEWWTWIDYSRFRELVLQYEESGGAKTFSASDYMARTPRWALFGARERGFDPKDTRYQRKNKAKDVSGC